MPLKWLTPPELSSFVINHTRSNNPFSMLRFGDGEYGICKYVKQLASRSEFYDRFERWFPLDDIPHEELVTLSKNVLEAFQHTDLLGVPCFKEAYGYPKWSMLDKFLEDNGMMNKKMFYFYDIFTLWRNFDTFGHVLNNRKEAFYIGSRDIGEGLKCRFNIGTVHQMLLQPEYFMWKGKNSGLSKFVEEWQGPRHYPEMYKAVCDWIDNFDDLKGKLFLVGAGGLGKIYCDHVRQHGGQSLDVGALVDGWAGLVTRPNLVDIQHYIL